jgi:hypothetical protein
VELRLLPLPQLFRKNPSHSLKLLLHPADVS